MELTEAQLKELQEAQEILELEDNHSWVLYRERIENAIASVNRKLQNTRMRNWDEYLAYWYLKEGLQQALAVYELQKAVKNTLTEEAKKEPDNSPATGELS